jgi:hypothetical protein
MVAANDPIGHNWEGDHKTVLYFITFKLKTTFLNLILVILENNSLKTLENKMLSFF